MIKDYHMHPQVVNIPEQFHEFAKTALENGVEEICITDHMPLLNNYQADRIPHGNIEKYCERVQELKVQYKGKLSIKCGIEIDYHPSVIDEIEAVLKAGNFDFVLGSSHLHVLATVNVFEAAKTHNNYAKAMFENTISAAKSGYFNAIAHLDMYRWIFATPSRFPLIDDGYSVELHEELIDKTLDTIKANNLRLEINPHFAVSSKNPENIYPNVSIVKSALDKGIKFSYGSDAHVSEDVGVMLNYIRNHEVYGKALKTWEEE